MPHSGIGALTPRPIKLRKLSVKIAEGTCSAAVIMMTLMLFGKICLRIMRPALAPLTFAASTYSLDLIVRICPRTILAIPVQ